MCRESAKASGGYLLAKDLLQLLKLEIGHEVVVLCPGIRSRDVVFVQEELRPSGLMKDDLAYRHIIAEERIQLSSRFKKGFAVFYRFEDRRELGARGKTSSCSTTRGERTPKGIMRRIPVC